MDHIQTVESCGPSTSDVSENRTMGAFGLEAEKDHLQDKIKSWLRQIMCFKVSRLKSSFLG